MNGKAVQNFEKVRPFIGESKFRCRYFLNKIQENENIPLLVEIFDRIRVLPISYAMIEITFSSINLNITKLRNQLSNETMKGILHGKSLIRDKLMYGVCSAIFSFDLYLILPNVVDTLGNFQPLSPV
ncbi:hypothetical protein PGB90_007756 [Kerria lacca]